MNDDTEAWRERIRAIRRDLWRQIELGETRNRELTKELAKWQLRALEAEGREKKALAEGKRK